MRAFSSVLTLVLALCTLSIDPVRADNGPIMGHVIAGVGTVKYETRIDPNTKLPSHVLCFYGKDKPAFKFFRNGKEFSHSSGGDGSFPCYKLPENPRDQIIMDSDQPSSTPDKFTFKNGVTWEVEVYGNKHNFDPLTRM